MSYHILKLEYCFDLPPIVVCSGRSIPWILSFPLYSIFLRPIVCSHWDIANVTLFCICNGPHYPLHCVQYYPCFVRKCAKYQHINFVLSHLVNTIVKRRKEGIEVFADLSGWRVNGGTVPPNMALTEQKPDLVVIDRSQTPAKVILVELTVPWDSANNFKAALDRKTARYERLTEDLIGAGLDARNFPIEIGCRGVINQRNAASLEYLCNLVGIRGIKILKGALGRIALIGSYRIWLARNSPEWTAGELIRVST